MLTIRQVYVDKNLLTGETTSYTTVVHLYYSCAGHGCNKIARVGTKTTSTKHMLMLHQVYVTKYILTGEITSYTAFVQAMDVKNS